MNEKDIIIDALCRTIRDKDKYIKELEDAIVYQKGIIDERKKSPKCLIDSQNAPTRIVSVGEKKTLLHTNVKIQNTIMIITGERKMANFDSGVKRYIKAAAVVETFFPVDWKDNAEIACKHCNYFVRATQRCGLTQQIVNFPDKYVGECCPLEEVSEDV